ncbi:TnpA transposase [Klebsiella pneumoniae]|nr:TnpA transposase [Klebsiella pneumoniae]
MLRKLGSYPRQNGLAVALRELGRIERTLFILDWLQSVELRRRVHAGLNKGEARAHQPHRRLPLAQQRQDRRGQVQAATTAATGLACFI